MDSAKKKKKERADIRIDKGGGGSQVIVRRSDQVRYRCQAFLGSGATDPEIKQPPTQSPPGCLNTAAGCRN